MAYENKEFETSKTKQQIAHIIINMDLANNNSSELSNILQMRNSKRKLELLKSYSRLEAFKTLSMEN